MSSVSGNEIPSNIRMMVQNISEITGYVHSEHDIYSMMKDCNMDPNETIHQLLLLDTFHEVKSKRDRRRENINREVGGSRWRAGNTQVRASRGGRASFPGRRISYDAGSSRNAGFGRVNRNYCAGEKRGVVSSEALQERTKDTIRSSSNGADVDDGTESVVLGSVSAVRAPSSPANAVKSLRTRDKLGDPMPSTSHALLSVTPASMSTPGSPPLDPILMPACASRPPSSCGMIMFGSHHIVCESKPTSPHLKQSMESRMSKFPSTTDGVGKDDLISEPTEFSSTPCHGGFSGSLPVSNDRDMSLPKNGPKKRSVEWTPKTTNLNVPHGSGLTASPDIHSVPHEATVDSWTENKVLDSAEVVSDLQKKLEELHLPQSKHVIHPSHINVSESEGADLYVGSFSTSSGSTPSLGGGEVNEKCPTHSSETSDIIAELLDERTAKYANSDTYPHEPQNLSGDSDVLSGEIPDLSGSNQKTTPYGSDRYPEVQTSPFENSDSQEDQSRIPSFQGQERVDCASSGARSDNSVADIESRVAAFSLASVVGKYTEYVPLTPSYISQSLLQGVNPFVLSTTNPNPEVTQATELMQRPLPLFHPLNYPNHYIPYGPYCSPYYGAPTGMHQFITNRMSSQRTQAAGMLAGFSYSLLPHVPQNDIGAAIQIQLPGECWPYGSSLAGYNPSPAATGGNSLSGSSGDIPGQQNEGTAMRMATPGQAMSTSSNRSTSFDNLHPSRATAPPAVHPLLQMLRGVRAGVNSEQETQHQQVNWPGNN